MRLTLTIGGRTVAELRIWDTEPAIEWPRESALGAQVEHAGTEDGDEVRLGFS